MQSRPDVVSVSMTPHGSRPPSSAGWSGDEPDVLRPRAVGWSWYAAAAAAAWLALLLIASRLGSATLAVAALPLPVMIAAAAGRAGGGHRRVFVVLAAIPVLAVVVALNLHSRPENAAIAGISLFLLTVPPWLVGRYARERQNLATAGWSSAMAWEREAKLAADHARMLERSALAAQMHDLLGHELAKAALLVGALELDRGLDRKVRQAAGDARRGISNAADRLYDAVRALDATHDSSTESLAARGLVNYNFDLIASSEAHARIETLVSRARAAGQEIELQCALNAAQLGACEPIAAGAVIAVVREGLTNAIKHSPGSLVRLSIVGEVDAPRARRSRSPYLVNVPPGPDDLLVDIRTQTKTNAVSDDADLSSCATGTGRGLRALHDGVEALGGSVRHGTSSSGLHRLQARVPRRPSRSLSVNTAAISRAPESSTARQRQVEDRVRRGGKQALLGVTAIAAGAVLLVVALTVFNASTSLLPDSSFDTMRIGTPRADLAPLLPDRTRTEDPDTVPPPPGATCQYYSTRVNPLNSSANDLYRLCFKDGVLVSKDLLRPARGYAGPTAQVAGQ